MRKVWVLLTAILVFLAVNASAVETLKQCKAKCKGANEADCLKCCADQDTDARNTCAVATFKVLKKCKEAAKGDKKLEAKCDSVWKKAVEKCWDDKVKMPLKGGCSDVPATNPE